MDERQNWVDQAKAIGIVLVVYGHVARGLHSAGIGASLGWPALVDRVIYSFHMPLFFFLSGILFLQSLDKRGARGLLCGKVDTVLYPYLVWSLLQGGIELGLSRHTNGAVTVSQVLSLLWAPRAQFWFLYALFCICVASTLVFSVLTRRHAVPVFLAAVVLSLLPLSDGGLAAWTLLCRNWVFFCLGVVCSLRGRVAWLAGRWSLLVTVALFVLSQWLVQLRPEWAAAGHGVGALLVACASIAFVTALSLRLAGRLGWLAWIGASSMAIYLMHILAGSGVRILLAKVGGTDAYLLHLVAGCMAGVGLPLLVTVLVGRWRIPWLFSAPLSAGLGALWRGGARARTIS